MIISGDDNTNNINSEKFQQQLGEISLQIIEIEEEREKSGPDQV